MKRGWQPMDTTHWREGQQVLLKRPNGIVTVGVVTDDSIDWVLRLENGSIETYRDFTHFTEINND